MTRLNIIFLNLIGRLKVISTQGPTIDEFLKTLIQLKYDTFINLAEQISTDVNELEVRFKQQSIPPDLSDVIRRVGVLKQQFPEFPENRCDEILLMLNIITKIIDEIEGDDNFNFLEDVNTDNFVLTVLTRSIRKQFFYFYDNLVVENSVLLFDFTNPDELSEKIINEQLPIEILFQLLAKLGGNDPLDIAAQHLLIKSGLTEVAVNAYIKLHIVKNGGYFHDPIKYHGSLNINPDRKIVPSRQYQQFQDALLIISEYNYQNYILDKYLRLYHVIENFMYRSPLVELGINNIGVPFSIRDFARLYKQVSTSEEDVLKKLLENVFSKEYNTAHLTFNQFIENKWRNLVPNETTEANINLLLSFMRINSSKNAPILFNHVDRTNLKNVFYKLVYNFRNSIVHNKDTELHLTHETLVNHNVMSNTANIILEKFLIPCMEEIVFFLIIEENDIVWYRHSKLVLWDDGIV